MKTTKYLFLMLLMSIFGMSASAQQRNVLQVPDVTVLIGNAQLPVIIENTDEIVGAQFDITLPDGITVKTTGTLSDRGNGHVVTVNQLSNGGYRVLLHSGANRPLLGQSGVVMYLPIDIPDIFEEGSEYQLSISNAVLGKATGENVLTEATAGKMRITKMPRLTVTASKTQLYEGEKMIVTVTNDRAPETDLSLNVSCDHPAKVTFPETVAMAAGSTSVTFEVEALQDTEVTDEQDIIITVTADNHYAGECQFSLLDDDRLPMVQTNKAVYKPGETVLISGQMFGLAANNAKAVVYIVHNGKREEIETRTDNERKFSAAYNISSNQSGHFSIEACLAGEESSGELASFDVFGLQLDSYRSESYIELGSPYTGRIIVMNTVALKQTGLKIEQQGDSTNCKFTFTAPEEIEADGSVEIGYTITPSAVTEGDDWQQMTIEITTAEGAKASYTFYYYIQSAAAVLRAEPSSIETTMTKGATREYPLVITNTGKGETGTITLGLPPFMKTATPLEIPSLASGESTTVLLEMTPTEEMTLNIPVTGNLAVNCKNGSGLSVGFSIEPVSESAGTLTVVVTDELTYYAETVTTPHVKDAKIEIKHPATYEVVAGGTSDEIGLFAAELSEGLYILEVSAPKHETYRNQIMIDPGKNKSIEAFLSYQNVTYDWNVVETEAEDTYNIELVADYDVRIPKPILDVKINVDEQPIDGTIIPIVVTNKGLINLDNVDVTLAVIPDEYSIEFQNNPHLDFLAPQQTETIYAKVIYNGPAEARRASGSKGGPGVSGAGSDAEGEHPCGNRNEKVHGSDMRLWELTPDEVTRIEEKIDELLEKLSDNSEGGGDGKPVKNDTTTNRPTWDYDYPTNVGKTKVCFDPTDPDDPNNPNRPDDPIDLPNHDGDPEPEPEDCDSDKEMHFSYHLEPVSGNRYELKGVAADGVSQVKLKLDSLSVIPKDDCKKYYGFRWELLDSLGTIKGNSFKEAIYTAPDSFPNNTGSSVKVKAIMKYWEKDDYDSFWDHELTSEPVEIEIIRPPVVFIHGLGDSESCWKKLDSTLVADGLYQKDVNYRINYRPTNTSSFMRNVSVVGLGIQKAQRRALCKGYVATKCDLVGHSMGGILSRLYLERGGKEEKKTVYRIITVNTPHSGSELGDIVSAHPVLLGNIAKIFYGKDDLAAIKDLGVESDEMALLVTVPGNIDIPVYALATESDFRDIILKEGSRMISSLNLGLLVLDLTLLVVDPEPVTKAWLTVIGAGLGLAATQSQHILEGDYAQIGPGDLVVSAVSQCGGCKASETIKHGPWHVNSPKNIKVIGRLKELLASNSTDSTLFSTDWFKPQKLEFKHDLGEQIISQLLNIPIISPVGSALSLITGWGFRVNVILDELFQTRGMPVETDNSNNLKRKISIDLDVPEGARIQFVSVSLNNHVVCLLEEGNTEYVLPSTFTGEVKLIAFLKDEDGNIYYDEQKLTIDEPIATPVSLALEETTLDIDDNEPLRLYCTWNDGTETKVVPDSIVFERNDVAALVGKYIVGLKKGRTKATAYYRGLSCEGLVRVFAPETDDKDDDDESSESVCSKVTLSFKQQMVTTRQAFRGTLTVNNGSVAKQLNDLKLNLEVKDEMGNVATAHEFQIDPESLEGFTGELDFTSGWSLDANSYGTATILFIPTKYAAPTEPMKWWFGGTFSYTDPDTGLTVTRDLYGVQLTVNPTAELDLDYFLQRDVFGDDPLTEDMVEDCQPAEFALIINNKGYGDARNVNMVTQKPEIIDNEKGLLIDFDILSSQLNGGETTLALGKTIPTDFGTIVAHSQAYAQWWLQSSLLGHFIKYNVNATHVSSRDNPDLSLLDQVKVHELIHGFTVSTDGDKPLRGFLVNDMPDSQDKPDAVFFTDATNQPVSIASDADVTKQSDSEYVLTVNASTTGWNYGSIPDPTNGLQKIVNITRADGTEIPLDNIWQTDRTLRDGKDPLYENRLHFVANVTGNAETFHLAFEPKDDITTSLLYIPDDLHVNISPLPLRDYMHITGNFKEIRQVSIYDMRGIKVFGTGHEQTGQNIYIGRLIAGVYYIQVATDRGIYRVKAMKR